MAERSEFRPAFPPTWVKMFWAVTFPVHDAPAVWATFGTEGGSRRVEVAEPLRSRRISRFIPEDLPLFEPVEASP